MKPWFWTVKQSKLLSKSMDLMLLTDWLLVRLKLFDPCLKILDCLFVSFYDCNVFVLGDASFCWNFMIDRL